jgi:hypothetical protein
MMSVTCGKILRPCRGDWDVLGRNGNLGRRESLAVPQATLRCPVWGRNVSHRTLKKII